MSGSRIIGRMLLFAGLWWILTEGRVDSWLLGGIAVIAATWASLALWPPPRQHLRLLALPGFVAFFIINSVRGGIQVALMALRGQNSLRPVFLDLMLDIPSGAPQVLLSSALGLMPGTVSVELADDRLRVHVLDARLPVIAEAKALERHIAILFGVLA